MDWHLHKWSPSQPRVMASSSGTRHLKNIDILVNATLTSMTTLIKNLPLCHWWQYSCPSNFSPPLTSMTNEVPKYTPCQAFFSSSSWIVVLHRYVTPPAMVLFILEICPMIDVFVFLHVMDHLPLSTQIPLAHEGLSLIHIWRCRRIERCRSRWSPYH